MVSETRRIGRNAARHGVARVAFPFDLACLAEMRQGGGKDRAFAKLVKAYRAASGVSLRTAQRHAAEEKPEWKAFVQGTAMSAGARESGPATPIEAVVMERLSPNRPPAQCPFGDRPDSELSEPELVLKATREMWQWSFDEWRATYRIDVGSALAHMAATLKCREAYERALEKYTAWEIEQRRLIPGEEFTAFRAEFVIPLSNALRGIPQELATEVNPSNPGHARAVLDDFLLNRLSPLIASLIDNLQSYVAAPPEKLAA